MALLASKILLLPAAAGLKIREDLAAIPGMLNKASGGILAPVVKIFFS